MVMDVACSTLAFTREPFVQALRHIAELEFTRIDLAVCETESHLQPSDVVKESSAIVQRIRQGPTIGFAAVTLRTSATDEALQQELDAVAHLAKQLAAPVLVIDAAPATTPMALEVERLTQLERIASLHGAVLTVTTRTNTLTEDPAVAIELCEKVSGLGLTLDPSHFICGPHRGRPFDGVYPFVRHVHLRDTGRGKDQLQVKVGRGEVEYGRVVTSLERYEFNGSLTVAIEEGLSGDLDAEAEVRKLRLLLESLI